MSLHLNIRPKITISLLVIVIGFLSLYETYRYVDARHVLSTELEELADQKITRMAEELEVPLWEVDENWVNKDIDTEMMDKRLFAIAIKGEGDLSVGRARDSRWQPVAVAVDVAAQKAGDVLSRESDVVRNGAKIGSVTIHISKKFMHDRLREELLNAVLAIVLLSGCMLLFLLTGLNTMIIRPIQKILGITQAVAKGDYSQDVDIRRVDEVGLLADGIEHMQKSIHLRAAERDKAENQLREKSAALEKANIELDRHRGRLEEEVKARTTELEQANRQLKELDQLKSMFIASMSHELRTPLNSIIGFTSITLDGLSGELNDTQRDQLQRVHKAGKHLLSLINDVIDISKVEAGRTDVLPAEFTLQDVVDEAVGVIQPLAAQKQLSLKVDIPQGTITLYTDRQRLLQCMLNLVSNAVKFTEKGGITLSARGIGKDVEIAVSDTGIGIAKEDLPKLFEAFERLESHLRIKAGGTGLGLYLTRRICMGLLQGRISVESTPGKGSIFTLHIPGRLEKNDA
ncbi:MAG: hypothetical protein COW19_06355 [Zetaproteobacteria bacterium CG12_big_fil_rev_8_21_14_0_65_55_1124]|nr:MAG: hypothetical protein AUJ58_00855 [Zetaproteobacteria bacterium CG1_02_55_237]PIS19689.1 MAG: hypothetical protein COT53_04400 [Zetaproteobacteria bacterium CG08_land_8_20_14_0_20_55_17]PIW42794.1 MAG: hypothetical protein COW19_06355 [Zetaproteobacteria bacterium CG12_big_fil_rev_8_21_14_0_65_55_1124]PIY54002.1 MAG: hypothetical protein COZ01_01820 [Zetaproteobacteria bacterium CG_4_10_14_0_8_um_filter_55_43]PIZ39598.1 MAG: hypothetical protein COY36_02565 [Zetaproteobacteria bacterium 